MASSAAVLQVTFTSSNVHSRYNLFLCCRYVLLELGEVIEILDGSILIDEDLLKGVGSLYCMISSNETFKYNKAG